MIKIIYKILGIGPKTDFKKLIEAGAVIIDVRSKGEFIAGNIPGSINMPIDQIATLSQKIKDKNTSLITCCASGMRSASANKILKKIGYENVYNGGGWHSLLKKIKP